MLSSVVPEIAEAKGIRSHRMEICFLIVVALATAMTVPVVGALLIFSLMIGPPAAARSLTSRPALAMLLSVAIALVTVWAAIAASYLYNWPVGFFVGALGALSYGIGRAWAAWHRTRAAPAADYPRCGRLRVMPGSGRAPTRTRRMRQQEAAGSERTGAAGQRQPLPRPLTPDRIPPEPVPARAGHHGRTPRGRALVAVLDTARLGIRTAWPSAWPWRSLR